MISNFIKALSMEHNIEWVENRKSKADRHYKLVHRDKRGFARIVFDRTQAE
jgi:hypothetical protein